MCREALDNNTFDRPLKGRDPCMTIAYIVIQGRPSKAPWEHTPVVIGLEGRRWETREGRNKVCISLAISNEIAEVNTDDRNHSYHLI